MTICGGPPAVIREVRPPLSSEHYPAYDGSSAVFGVAPDYEAPIRYAKKGLMTEVETPASTIGQLFHRACDNAGDKYALYVERPTPTKDQGSLPDEQWTKWTYAQYRQDATRCAKAFLAIGVPQHASCNVFGFNSPEWIISSMGCILSGVKIAGIYPTDTVDQVAYKSSHANAYVAIVEDKSKFDKYVQRIDDMPNLKAVVTYVGSNVSTSEVKRKDGSTVKVYGWEDFLKQGDTVGNEDLENRTFQIKPGHCAAIVYTSGTTGQPKGVMISHDNLCAVSSSFDAEISRILRTMGGGGQERMLSYLPLSHIAGFLLDVILPLVVTQHNNSWLTMYFARTYDLRESTLPNRLQFVKPTIFFGVPRVWEKIAERLRAIGATVTGIKKKMSTAFKAKVLYWSTNQQVGGNGGHKCCHNFAIKKLKIVKEKLGLECVKLCATGAAPISADILEYFGSLGLPIMQLYGMSECTGACSFSTPLTYQWGTCGFALSGIEMCIAETGSDGRITRQIPPCANFRLPTEAEQGEICFRGRTIMMGYLANPDFGPEHIKDIEKKTKDAIDVDGWMHSGDKGCVTKDGMYKITGRYKELIIGAGGENIAPVPIEDNIKRLCGAISNVMMVGDQKKYNTMLVTLKTVGATGEKPGTDELVGAAANLIPGVTLVSQAMTNDAYKAEIQKAIDATNADPLVCQNNSWKVQKFVILPRDFSLETEELTPTMKCKRNVVTLIWKKEIDAMYGE